MSDKLYARHYKLRSFVHYYKIMGYGLGSEIGRSDAYDLYHNDYLGLTNPASNVLGNLRGADKNASAFGLTTKGLLEFWKMFPDDELGNLLKEQVFEKVFNQTSWLSAFSNLRRNDSKAFHREYKEKMNEYWSSI